MATVYNSPNYEFDVRDRTMILATSDVEEARFIGYDGDYPSAGELAAGVSEYSVEDGNAISLFYRGIARIEIPESQNITKGDEIAAGTNGVGVEATTGDIVLGIAKDSVITSSGENAFISIELVKYQKN